MTTYQPAFTVFTPTYNRAHTLPRVYAGLRAQTYQNFEWLIIDDGSTDGTGEIVAQWRAEAEFPVRYDWQENRGKHIAHNAALERARGEFFLVLDSDDSLVPAALERLLATWESIPVERKDEFCGVAGLCADQHGAVVGAWLPAPVMDVSLLEMRFVYKRSQEFTACYKTAIVKEFPFPELENAKFIPEGLVWSQIGGRYKTRYINEALQIYYVEADAETLMRSNPINLAASHSLWHRFTLNHEIAWFRYQPSYFLSSAIHYIRFSLHKRAGLLVQVSDLNNYLARLLWVAMLPLGVAVCLRDRVRQHG